jgi:hypothetical protein
MILNDELQSSEGGAGQADGDLWRNLANTRRECGRDWVIIGKKA